MQAQNLERTSSKSSYSASDEHEHDLPRHAQKPGEHEEECKPQHGQTEVMSARSAHSRTDKLTQAANLDLPKEILNSLLPPLSTPQEYMAGQLQFDSTDQDT